MIDIGRRRVGAAAVLLSVVLGACGDDDEPSTADVPAERDAYVSEAVAAMGLPDDESSQCLAGTVVDAIGMQRIVDAELTPEAFARATSFAEMDVVVDDVEPTDLQTSLAGCGDLVALFVRDAPDAEAEACIRGVMTDELVAESMVDELTGGAAGAELTAALDATFACARTTATTG
jgi:hypothetical protein